jgi:hypothetical protein
MGRFKYDATTKSYKVIAAVPASQMRSVDGAKIPSAIQGLLEAFNEVRDAAGVPIEIVVRISGREDRGYSVVLNEAQELQEILQWCVVDEE